MGLAAHIVFQLDAILALLDQPKVLQQVPQVSVRLPSEEFRGIFNLATSDHFATFLKLYSALRQEGEVVALLGYFSLKKAAKLED